MFTKETIKKTTRTSAVCLSLVVLFSFSFITYSNSQTLLNVISKEDLDLDTSLIEDSNNYGQPESILIAPIFKEAEMDIDYNDWYRGIFYYLSSDRFNFKDIPAHYIMDKDGTIYEGIEGGSEKRILVEGDVNNPVVIFYLAERGDSDFSTASLDVIKSLTLNVANENSIEPDNIYLSRINLEINETSQQVNLRQEEIFGSWKITFNEIIENVDKNYSPTQKSYDVEVTSFDSPNNSVQANKEIVLKIEIKNNGDNTIFGGSDSELILSRSGATESQFFLNDQWISPSELRLMNDGDLLKPEETKTYEFRVKSPFRFGRITEEFVLKTAGGQTFKNEKVTISLNIERGNIQLLEIAQTETGTLNVRQDPTVGSAVVGIVSPGERFEWTESNNSGWYKIKFNGKTGWVLNRYVSII